jgi:hypothetical protein
MQCVDTQTSTSKAQSPNPDVFLISAPRKLGSLRLHESYPLLYLEIILLSILNCSEGGLCATVKRNGTEHVFDINPDVHYKQECVFAHRYEQKYSENNNKSIDSIGAYQTISIITISLPIITSSKEGIAHFIFPSL